MALHKLERINYGRKWLVSIKYQNLHSFKEGLILLCSSILETRRITHLHGSAHFTIPLSVQLLHIILICLSLLQNKLAMTLFEANHKQQLSWIAFNCFSCCHFLIRWYSLLLSHLPNSSVLDYLCNYFLFYLEATNII